MVSHVGVCTRRVQHAVRGGKYKRCRRRAYDPSRRRSRQAVCARRPACPASPALANRDDNVAAAPEEGAGAYDSAVRRTVRQPHPTSCMCAEDSGPPRWRASLTPSHARPHPLAATPLRTPRVRPVAAHPYPLHQRPSPPTTASMPAPRAARPHLPARPSVTRGLLPDRLSSLFFGLFPPPKFAVWRFAVKSIFVLFLKKKQHSKKKKGFP